MLYGFDLETFGGGVQEYALQPWRYRPLVRGSEPRITWYGFAREDGKAVAFSEEQDHLKAASRLSQLALEGATVCGWNISFDVAWLCARRWEHLAEKIRWVDGMLLWKWVEPNLPSYKLAAAVEKFLRDMPWQEEYLALKRAEKEANFTTDHTSTYVQFDAYVPIILVQRLWSMLTPRQQASAAIEMQMIYPVATSWLRGVNVDLEQARSLLEPLKGEMEELQKKLGLTDKQLRSPKQLSKIFYEEWGWGEDLRALSDTETGTDKTVLTYATDQDPRALDVLHWRERNTRLTKYAEGTLKSATYNGEPITHAQPRIYSTYTGRMTYSSKATRSNQHPIGVPLHQWCREEQYRKIIVAPKGYRLVEYDASGQEMRFMAEKSDDPAMLRVFRDGMDAHSYTGAGIAGISYESFMDRKALEDEEIVGPKGYRYLGKVANLSLQYRTGIRTLRRKARVDYGVDVEWNEASHWYHVYHDLFGGVKDYWVNAILVAKECGFAETFAGRRYYLERWRFGNDETKWGVESSAINFPIQGAGADQKELAIALVRKYFPDFIFLFDLHDGLYLLVSVGTPESRLLACRQMLNEIDYRKYWGWSPRIPFLWDCAHGERWGEMEKMK